MAGVSAARKVAFDILLEVNCGRVHSDAMLRGRAVERLSAADRNLATALVLGTLRWQIRLDHELRALLAKPDAKLDHDVSTALRLGAFQLRMMDRIPARAAIDESVELTKLAGHRHASRMVNAVLRKLAIGEIESWKFDTPSELAIAQAHPAWMVERWVQFYGLEAAKGICAHGQRQPSFAVRLTNSGAEAELTAGGFELKPGQLLSDARIVLRGDGPESKAFQDGSVRPQDEGSQLVAELVARGEAILDCCAAPGGKTLILAERNPAGHLVVCEASKPRMEQLRKRLHRLSGRVELRLVDATQLTDVDAYDVVLADVPCSGTGTLGRNPEIRLRISEDDLHRHANRQKSILQAALRAVKPGGRVIYSTCSMEREENEEVIRAILASQTNVKEASLVERIVELRDEGILTAKGAVGLIESVTPEGFLRLLPGALGTDGFFVAQLEKAS